MHTHKPLEQRLGPGGEPATGPRPAAALHGVAPWAPDPADRAARALELGERCDELFFAICQFRGLDVAAALERPALAMALT